MSSTRSFCRTVIQIEVLSEYPYEFESLEEVAYDITEGGYSGDYNVISSEIVDGPTMVKLLRQQDSDPEFFNLTEDGDDLDEVG